MQVVNKVDGEVYALKRVVLADLMMENLEYMIPSCHAEHKVLEKLSNEDNIIQMYQYEVKLLIQKIKVLLSWRLDLGFATIHIPKPAF